MINIQIYRPQLTSVLSIANRITGVILSLGAIGLVIWLTAAAMGPRAYDEVQGVVVSWEGRVLLFGFTFAFFMHLCGGCCQSKVNSSPVWRNSPKPGRALSHDGAPLSQGG